VGCLQKRGRVPALTSGPSWGAWHTLDPRSPLVFGAPTLGLQIWESFKGDAARPHPSEFSTLAPSPSFLATRTYLVLLTSSNFSRNLVGCFLTPSPHVILPALTQEGSGASRRLILSRRSAVSISGSGRAVEESLFDVSKTRNVNKANLSHKWFLGGRSGTCPERSRGSSDNETLQKKGLSRFVRPDGLYREAPEVREGRDAPSKRAFCAPAGFRGISLRRRQNGRMPTELDGF